MGVIPVSAFFQWTRDRSDELADEHVGTGPNQPCSKQTRETILNRRSHLHDFTLP